MKTKQFVASLLSQIPNNATHIPTGLTNDNYIVNYEGDKYVVRIPKQYNSHRFDYALESRIIEMIKPLDIDISPVYYDESTGIKITPYVAGAKQFDLENVHRVPKLLRTLHDANLKSGKRYDIRKEFRDYYDAINDKLFDLDPFVDYIDDTWTLSDNWRVCHNDVVPGNLLFTQERAYLIDYEYACDNDPIFDLMSFITENNINDKSIRDSIYDRYFNRQIDMNMILKLHTFECALNVLWCAWAMLMYENEPLPVFKNIAITKYLNLLKEIRTFGNTL